MLEICYEVMEIRHFHGNPQSPGRVVSGRPFIPGPLTDRRHFCKDNLLVFFCSPKHFREVAMDSVNCPKEMISDALAGKSLLEAITVIEREVTSIERQAYRSGSVEDHLMCAAALKATIMYLRYGVRSSSLTTDMQAVASAIRESASQA
jgi:hypothetical protein